MKNYLKKILVSGLLIGQYFTFNKIFAQDFVKCANPPSIALSNVSTTSNCGLGYTYSTKYSRIQTYIPNANTPIKTIKVAFHFFQKTDGSNMFQDNAVTHTIFNNIIADINNKKSSIDLPSSPIAGVQYIADSKVRYEITGMYFYKNDILNSQYFGTVNNFATLTSAVNAVDPTRLNSIPIFFTSPNPAPGAYNPSGQVPNFSNAQDFNFKPSTIIWETGATGNGGATIEHELGHLFNLHHTYDSDELVKTSTEYLSDVFETNWWNYCSPPSGNSCYHQAYWNWDPFDHITHPHATNNIMGGCLYAHYISPMQLGKIHRMLAIHSLRKYVKEMTSESNYPFVVTNNETWDFDIQMYQDIVVKQGATLTLKCRVGMANNGRIIVERGARLIIDGGEVFPWGTSWEGVQVWGTSNQRQIINANGLSTYHGIVNVINGGTLRDAKNAITTTKNDADGNIDWGGYFGGIIQCKNAKFINNWVSVSFFTFHNKIGTTTLPNISYIYNSIFETTGLLKDPSQPYPNAFISLWAVEGVKLFGNTLKNTSPTLPPILNRGVGIVSFDGSFYLDRYKLCGASGINGCVSYSTNNPSIFSNLNYGVHTTEMSPFSNISINDIDFINCNRAVLISGTHNSKITNNRIDIAEGGVLITDQPYGIYSEYSTGYDISNNNITTTIPATFNNNATGIFINGTGGFTNMLYRNTINKVNVGTTIFGDNKGINPGDGLRLKCNQYGQTIQNYLDIWLHEQQIPWGNVGMIDSYQGNSSIGANNRFSHTAGSYYNHGDFHDDGNPIVNYYFNPEITQKTKPLYYSTQLITNQNITSYNDITMCPDKSSGSSIKSLEYVRNLITVNTNSINILYSKIDGGNTQVLLDAVSNSENIENLKDLVEQNSPLLSDTVLIAYFTKESTPPEHIKFIYDKNKPVSPLVWQKIVNLNLQGDIFNYLKVQQATLNSSAITNLYAQIATLNQEKGDVVDTKVRDMLSDTVNGFNQDSVSTLLLADTRFRAKNRLLASYVANEKLTNATNLLIDIATENGGSLDNFSKFQEILISLKQNAQGLYSIKTNQELKDLVEQIANDKTNEAYIHAQALLKLVFGSQSFEYISLPKLGNGLRLKQNQETGEFTTVSKNMIIYPNPTNNNTIVSYLLTDNFGIAEIIVMDVMGKTLLKQTLTRGNNEATINTQNLKAGLYFINLMIDGALTETQKLIKQ